MVAKACSPAKYKKCILTAIRGTKISTAKGARMAFQKATKKCRTYLGLPVVHRRKPKVGARRKRRATIRSIIPGMPYYQKPLGRRRITRANRDYIGSQGGQKYISD